MTLTSSQVEYFDTIFGSDKDQSQYVEIGLLPRDESQTIAANLIPMTEFLEVIKLIQVANALGSPLFGRMEVSGGQQPATDLAQGINPLEVLQKISSTEKKASDPETIIQTIADLLVKKNVEAELDIETLKQNLAEYFQSNPLNIKLLSDAMLARGAYVIGLEARTEPDAEKIFLSLIEASLGKSEQKLDNKSFYLKVFDSQLNVDEMRGTFRVAVDLAQKGKQIRLEAAMPFAEGPVFTDEFYLKRLDEYLKALAEEGVIEELRNGRISEVLIGLKDMVGYLDAEKTANLLPKFFAKISEFESEYGIKGKIAVAIHSHDTGHAAEANNTAAKLAISHKRKVVIDCIPDFFNDEMNDKERSFAGVLASVGNIEGLLSPAQKVLLEECAEKWKDVRNNWMDKLSASGKVTRPSDFPFENDELRAFEIPGGGRSHLMNAIKSYLGKANYPFEDPTKLAEKDRAQQLIDLGLSEKEMALLAGRLISGVSSDFGYFTSVTPGFTFKYELAIGMLDSAIRDGHIEQLLNIAKADAKNPDGTVNKAQDEIAELKLLMNFEQRYGATLKSDNGEKAKFLRGRMPGGFLEGEALEVLCKHSPDLITENGTRKEPLSNSAKAAYDENLEYFEGLKSEWQSTIGLAFPFDTEELAFHSLYFKDKKEGILANFSGKWAGFAVLSLDVPNLSGPEIIKTALLLNAPVAGAAASAEIIELFGIENGLNRTTALSA